VASEQPSADSADLLPRPGLDSAACRLRQHALRHYLAEKGLEAALICDRRHVHYLTGYWCPASLVAIALIERDGPTTLVTPFAPEEDTACESLLIYESQLLCTLIDDHTGAAVNALGDRLAGLDRIGSDAPLYAWRRSPECLDLNPYLRAARRAKWTDEVALLTRAIAATEAAYQYAYDALQPGITEVELFAGIQAAAAASAGEVLGEFGNDFQIGANGSSPRRRPAQEGEVAILDLSVVLRGYSSDMCRSFVVGRRPSQAQWTAHRRIIETLAFIEEAVQPGGSCRALFHRVHEMLDGFHGWSFHHHLGHGIGMSPHEAPRLNPHWDDSFQLGDVFAAEPGLYGAELRAGMRIEQVYHLTESGLKRLSGFPTDPA
jgi:Xaa-Pro aminopeptidase